MHRNGVSSAMVAGLLVFGILIGATGFYAATYQTKTATQTDTATQTETTTVSLPTTSIVTLPNVTVFAYDGFSQNSSISVSANETFIVELSSNAYDSGHVWYANTSTGIQYFNYTVVPSSLGCCGYPSLYYYFFRAVQAGTQTITLQAKQPSTPYAILATINLELTVSTS